MKRYRRKIHRTQSISKKTAKARSGEHYAEESQPSGLLLLLPRPSLIEIFKSPTDDSTVGFDAVITSFGTYDAKDMNRQLLQIVPLLCVAESGYVGYTMPMRLDLQLCLHQLANQANPPLEYPIGLFDNRDVLLIAEGLYAVSLLHNSGLGDNFFIEHMPDELLASKIIYSCTTTHQGVMGCLRRLEDDAKKLLTPEPRTLPQLPSDIIGGVQEFLRPIFNRARESRP